VTLQTAHLSIARASRQPSAGSQRRIQAGAVAKGTSPELPRGMNQRGVAAVEFALLLPVLIMVLFGIIEFGIALSRQQVLDTASREGARLGIRQAVPRPTAADIQALARRVFTQAGVTGVDAHDCRHRRGRPQRDRSHRDGVGALSVLCDGECDPGTQRDRDASIAHADET
jgi:hypothetical protein